MSYNSYPNSNPNYHSYYQQSTNERSQYTDQSRNNNAYPSSSYQPLSAYQTSQQAHSYASQPANSATANSYPSYGQTQDARDGYNYARTSLDTSALGNLAHASSLGRDNSSNSPALPYGSNQSNAGYRYPSAYSANRGHLAQHNAGNGYTENVSRTTSRNDNRARTATATASPSFGHSSSISNNQAQSQHQRSGSGMTGQAKQLPSPHQYQPLPYGKPPSRPASSQAAQRSDQKPASQSLQSPTIRTNPVALSTLNGQNPSRATIGNSNTPAPKQATIQQASHQVPYTPPTNDQQRMSAASSKSILNPQSVTPSNAKPVPTSNTPRNDSSNQNPAPTNQSHTTVDPSQVFNDAEYRRRQAAAAAELEAARRKVQEAPKSTQQDRPPDSANSNDAESARKAQMELEMKTMIEKMRDYKSKDPSLFSQIWEQVKKGQPTPKPPIPAQANSQPATISPIAVDSHSPGPQLPPEPEFPAADPFPDGADRGRFPAQRRRRGNTHFTPPKKAATPKTKGKQQEPAAVEPVKQVSEAQKPLMTPPVAQMVKQNRPLSPANRLQLSTSSAANSVSQPVANPPLPPPPLLPPPPPPPPPRAGRTYWPEHKKRELAEAAKAALMSVPQNLHKWITADELHTLLDQNPSYTQMCEILEYRGFILDRGQFARQLLATVPDLSSASSKPPASIIPPTKPLPHGLPGPPGPPAALSPAPSDPQASVARPWPHSVRRDIPGGGQVTSYPPPNISPLAQQYINGSSRAIPAAPPNPQSRNGMWYGDAPFSSVGQASPQPPTKQDLARKRNISDIVDLTQGLSDDEDQPPRQRSRVESDDDQPAPAPPLSAGIASLNKASSASLNKFRAIPSTGDAGNYRQSKDVARQINKRQDALLRSLYDPRSIARDVIMAVGKHPTTAPLNSHLGNIKDKFSAISRDSDLGSFGWDVVDPIRPHAPKKSSPNPDAKYASVAVVLGNNSGSTQDRKGLKRSSLKPSRGGHYAAPGRPRKDDASEATAAFDFSNYVSNDLPAMLTSIPGSNGPFKHLAGMSDPQGVNSASPATPSERKKVGRPPGAKNKNPRPDKGRLKGPRNSTTAQKNESSPNQGEKNAPTPAEKKESSPNQSKSTPQFFGQNYLFTKQQTPLQNQPIKPRGLRKVTSPTNGVAVVLPSRSPSVIEVSRTGPEPSAQKRKSSNANGITDKATPAPAPASAYKIFRCRWDNCPAELHSLEILRKHVRKHRNSRREDGSIPCLWAKCRHNTSNSDDEKQLVFDSEIAWHEHVEGTHIDPVAQEPGDAPSTVSSEAKSPDKDTKFQGSFKTPISTPRKRIRLNSSASTSSSAKAMIVIPC